MSGAGRRASARYSVHRPRGHLWLWPLTGAQRKSPGMADLATAPLGWVGAGGPSASTQNAPPQTRLTWRVWSQEGTTGTNTPAEGSSWRQRPRSEVVADSVFCPGGPLPAPDCILGCIQHPASVEDVPPPIFCCARCIPPLTRPIRVLDEAGEGASRMCNGPLNRDEATLSLLCNTHAVYPYCAAWHGGWPTRSRHLSRGTTLPADGAHSKSGGLRALLLGNIGRYGGAAGHRISSRTSRCSSAEQIAHRTGLQRGGGRVCQVLGVSLFFGWNTGARAGGRKNPP